MEKQQLLTLGAMARRLGVHPNWLRQAAERGDIPHVRAGDGYIFCPITVEAVLLKRAREIPG